MFVIWIEFLLRIRREISMLDVMISLVAIAGMSLIYYGNEVNTIDLHLYKWAIFYGIMAAMLASIFTIMNKKASKEIEPLAISFVEMMTGAILLFFVLLSQNLLPQISQIALRDWFWILILSVLCTNIPFLLSIYALKKLNPFTVTLSVNLEPIYGMLLAGIFFQEYKNFNLYFFIGSFLILISVFLPLIFNRDESK